MLWGMELEKQFHEECFPVGKELLIDGALYTVMHAEPIDDYPKRIQIFLKREKGEL